MFSQSDSFVCTNSLERGGGVRARAHACVALGRCVAFGRPKMSVWGHAGARSAPAKVACISFTTSLFWYLFEVSVSSFRFQTPLHQNSLETLNGHSQLRTRWRSFRALTVTLTLARGRTPTPTHHAHPCYRESRTGHDPRRCYARRYELPGLPGSYEASEAHMYEGTQREQAAHFSLRRFPPCQALGHRVRTRSHGN